MEITDLVLQAIANFDFVQIKNGEPMHSLSKPKTFDEIKDWPDVAVLIPEPYVVLDFDDMHEYEVACRILNDQSVNSWQMRSDNGGHIWLKSQEPLTNNIKISTPLTLMIDVKSHGKKSLAHVKKRGTWRTWEKYSPEVDKIPVFLRPIKSDVRLFNMRESEGRNATLYSYIIPLIKQVGLSKSEVREVFRLINKYILREPLSESELNTLMRDEAFDDLRPAFFDKTRFMHEVFGEYIKTNNYIFKENGRVYIYDRGYFSQDSDIVESQMIDYIPSINSAQRREVMNYLRLRSEYLKPVNPYVIACENGALDIRDMTLRENSPSNFNRNKIPTYYNPQAKSEVVDRVLNKIVCGDTKLRMLIEEMIGYILLPTAKFQKAFILFGEGSNGKSTLLDMIMKLVGDVNVSSLSMQELNHNFKLAEITNKLVNIGDDISDSYLDDSSTFKKLVSGEEITVDKKNESPYKLKNYAGLLFATNNLPQAKDKSEGFSRRLIIIPFNARFSPSDDDYDPFIIDKLTSPEAMSYLLNLAVHGVSRVFRQQGFTKVESVEKTVTEYLVENNNVLQFLEEIDIEDMAQRDSYREYEFWCTQVGVKALKYRNFSKEIRKHTNLDTIQERRGKDVVTIWQSQW